MSVWKGKRVLVTGGAGFLGSHLVRRLVREHALVTVVDRARHPAGFDHLADVSGMFEWCPADMEDRQALRALLHRLQPEHLFHLAGRVDLARTADMTDPCIHENISATANLLWGLEGIAFTSCVFASTTEVYGHNPAPFHEEQPVDPPSPYAISKVAAEHFCRFFIRAYRYPMVILRMSAVYGPHQSIERLIPAAILAMLGGRRLAMTSGEQQRDFIYVDDAVEGLMRAASIPAARGETINLGHERAISLRELIDTIRGVMKTSWQPSYGEVARRIDEPAVLSCSHRKATQILGWKPATELEDGLRATIEAYRATVKPRTGRVPLVPV